MSKTKSVNPATLSFSDLKDKTKKMEGLEINKKMNRFEIVAAVSRAEGRSFREDLVNPREVKPKIGALKKKLAEAEGKARRRVLRRSVARLKKVCRQYYL